MSTTKSTNTTPEPARENGSWSRNGKSNHRYSDNKSPILLGNYYTSINTKAYPELADTSKAAAEDIKNAARKYQEYLDDLFEGDILYGHVSSVLNEIRLLVKKDGLAGSVTSATGYCYGYSGALEGEIGKFLQNVDDIDNWFYE